MPVIGPRFRPVPALAPLAAPEVTFPEFSETPPLAPPEPPAATDGTFAEDHEVSRVAPSPRFRGSSASAGPRMASAAGPSMASAGGSSSAPAASTGMLHTGGHSTNRSFVGKLSITNWDVNPHQVARDLGVTK